MIVQVDLAGRRIYASPASRALLGRSPQDMVGSRPEDDAHPDDVATLSAMVGRLSRGEAETEVASYRLRRSDGTYLWVEGSWCLVRDAAGRRTATWPACAT